MGPPWESLKDEDLLRTRLCDLGVRIEFVPGTWTEQAKSARAGKLMMWFLSWNAEAPDGDAFLRFGMPPAKLRVLDYGFAPLVRLNGVATPHAPLRIGYVGTIVWHKGVHVLVDAVRPLPPQAYELRIFGDRAVAPDYVADLERRAVGLPVRFMGAVDRDRIADAYGGVDVLVVPSLWPENSPLVVREAFMAGKPVVAARIGGLGDLVAHDVNGLLYEPRSTAALTEALRSLLGDSSRRDALARGIPAVKSMAVHSREWEAIYTDLLGRA